MNRIYQTSAVLLLSLLAVACIMVTANYYHVVARRSPDVDRLLTEKKQWNLCKPTNWNTWAGAWCLCGLKTWPRPTSKLSGTIPTLPWWRQWMNF